MSAEDILKLLDKLPTYITLFYPGYLTIYLYFFFSGKRFKDEKWIVIKAVFISYVYNVFCDGFLKWRNIYQRDGNESLENVNYAIWFNIALIIIAIVVGFFAAKIRESKYFGNLLEVIKGDISFSEDEFEILRNKNRSAWVCVYIKDSNLVYEGSLREVNLNTENKKYVCLSGYYKYLIDKNGKPIQPYIENLSDNNDEKVVIYYDDILLVEKRDCA